LEVQEDEYDWYFIKKFFGKKGTNDDFLMKEKQRIKRIVTFNY